MKCLLCNTDISTTLLTDTLRDNQKVNVYYCSSCDLGILDYWKTEQQLQDFYKSQYRLEPPEKTFADFSRFQKERIDLLSPYLSSQTKLLEVGSSSGMFLHGIRNKVQEVKGFDYDENSSNFTEKICNCQVYRELEQIPLHYFDVICIYQTLEHVFNPVSFLQYLIQSLKPTGIIHIEVPNLRDALVSTYCNKAYTSFYFHVAHLWYFTATSLSKLLKIVGFEGIVYFVQDYNVLNHLSWIQTGKPQQYTEGRKIPSVPVQLEEINCFFSRMDKDYKDLLKQFHITDNIHFIGKRMESV